MNQTWTRSEFSVLVAMASYISEYPYTSMYA